MSHVNALYMSAALDLGFPRATGDQLDFLEPELCQTGPKIKSNMIHQ
jgi:hypothetical protein